MSIINLLFLDIDGVIVTEKWGTPNWNKSCVAALSMFLKECEDVKIVLSSAWRKKPQSVHAFMSLMCDIGFYDRVIGITPDIDLLHRDKEIITYLNSLANARLMLDIEDYVKRWLVLDDSPEFFRGGEVPDTNMLIVNRTTGLTSSAALLLIDFFRR